MIRSGIIVMRSDSSVDTGSSFSKSVEVATGSTRFRSFLRAAEWARCGTVRDTNNVEMARIVSSGESYGFRDHLFANSPDRRQGSGTQKNSPGDSGAVGERKTGFEPATFSLARRCSTAEPLPRAVLANGTRNYSHGAERRQDRSRGQTPRRNGHNQPVRGSRRACTRTRRSGRAPTW